MSMEWAGDDEDLARFGVDVRMASGQCVVTVAGDVDAATAPMLGGILDVAFAQGATDLIVDLGAATFMDAAGLRVLDAASSRFTKGKGRFVLRAVPPGVERILQITGLDSKIAIELAAPAVVAVCAGGAERVEIRVPRGTRAIDERLDLVTALAAATVDGADGASVTLERGGRFMTVAFTDETMLRVDHHQYDTGQGPCVAAATEGTEFHLRSVATEDRWPAFVPLAADEGVAAIMSTPLISGGRPVGALNIYSNTDDAFGTAQRHVAELLAAQASEIVADIDSNSEHRRRPSDALLAREVIAQARGILMERHHIGAHQADGALHRGARSAERTVQAEAQRVLSSIDAVATDDGKASGP